MWAQIGKPVEYLGGGRVGVTGVRNRLKSIFDICDIVIIAGIGELLFIFDIFDIT